jgi:hypothetical protein
VPFVTHVPYAFMYVEYRIKFSASECLVYHDICLKLLCIQMAVRENKGKGDTVCLRAGYNYGPP